jgi:hypothetical protein
MNVTLHGWIPNPNPDPKILMDKETNSPEFIPCCNTDTRKLEVSLPKKRKQARQGDCSGDTGGYF